MDARRLDQCEGAVVGDAGLVVAVGGFFLPFGAVVGVDGGGAGGAVPTRTLLGIIL